MNMKMKQKICVTAFMIGVALLAARATPVLGVRPCPACHGKKSLSLTPPNLGQYDGEIGVTPGKPFTSHRWDVKHEHCPLCEGTGRQEFYRQIVDAPSLEEAAGFDKCVECNWSGVTPCMKCSASGFTACPACKSSRGKPGWIKEERRTPGRTSRHVKVSVTPCGKCSGIGRVVCPTCLGKGAVPCRRCKGEGRLPQKGKR